MGTGLLFISTMLKIYERWRDANVRDTIVIGEAQQPGAPDLEAGA